MPHGSRVCTSWFEVVRDQFDGNAEKLLPLPLQLAQQAGHATASRRMRLLFRAQTPPTTRRTRSRIARAASASSLTTSAAPAFRAAAMFNT